MKIGIIGFPQSGKRTLVEALLPRSALSSASKKKTNQQLIVNVTDERLNQLSNLFQPRRQVNATVEYWLLPDIEISPNGKHGGSTWLSELKNVDAILILLRAFRSESVPHPLGRVDAIADARWLTEELLLADLAVVESRLERLAKQIKKTNAASDQLEQALLRRCQDVLERGEHLRTLDFTNEEHKLLRGFQFLTAKPVIFGLNLDEQQLTEPETLLETFAPLLAAHTTIIPLSARIEYEITLLEPKEQPEFLSALGLKTPVLDRLVRASYDLLQLISFFTVGEDECRAWTIKRGTPAGQAARAIHSDIERGFIRAEVVYWADLIAQQSLAACRKMGLLRSEGKQYLVQDGDVIEFLFNV